MPGPVVQDQEDDPQQQLNSIKDQRKFEKDDEAIVEDVNDGQDEDKQDDDDADDDEDDNTLDADGEQGGGGNESSKQSRSEKKSRKAMQKLGMKSVLVVGQVTIKRTNNILFVISKRVVFKSRNSKTYVIFGEAKVEDLSAQLQSQAAQQFKIPDMASLMPKLEISAAAAGAQADDEEEEVDDTGVEARDIDLVMTQAEVTKSKAVKALKTHNGDIVSAIMELTT